MRCSCLENRRTPRTARLYFRTYSFRILQIFRNGYKCNFAVRCIGNFAVFQNSLLCVPGMVVDISALIHNGELRFHIVFFIKIIRNRLLVCRVKRSCRLLIVFSYYRLVIAVIYTWINTSQRINRRTLLGCVKCTVADHYKISVAVFCVYAFQKDIFLFVLRTALRFNAFCNGERVFFGSYGV